ncbi:uncharacterized protein METZ01_LOCUS192248, partial [marine metagenome]
CWWTTLTRPTVPQLRSEKLCHSNWKAIWYGYFII